MSDDLESRLAAARARKAEAVARADAARAASMLALDVERAEREAEDAEALTKAECEHGPVGVKLATVETSMGLVILKRPNTVMFRRFQDKGSFTCDAVEALVRPCVVHPDAKQLDRILGEQPGVLSMLADRVVFLAGARAQELAGK